VCNLSKQYSLYFSRFENEYNFSMLQLAWNFIFNQINKLSTTQKSLTFAVKRNTKICYRFFGKPEYFPFRNKILVLITILYLIVLQSSIFVCIDLVKIPDVSFNRPLWVRLKLSKILSNWISFFIRKWISFFYTITIQKVIQMLETSII